MTYKISSRDWRSVVDEFGEQIFYFTGSHMDDLRVILTTLNQKTYSWYSKSTVEI